MPPPPPDSLELLRSAVDQAAKPEVRAKNKAKATKTTKKPAATQDTPGTFYVYVDNDGLEHIVDSFQLVPKKHRSTAKKWVMDTGDERGEHDPHKQVKEPIGDTVGLLSTPAAPGVDPVVFHLPSFLLGLIVLAVLFLCSFLFKRKTKPVLKMILFAVALVIAGGAYFSWVRRQAGLGDDNFASPSAVIKDASRATEQLGKRQREQQQLLDEIHGGTEN